MARFFLPYKYLFFSDLSGTFSFRKYVFFIRAVFFFPIFFFPQGQLPVRPVSTQRMAERSPSPYFSFFSRRYTLSPSDPTSQADGCPRLLNVSPSRCLSGFFLCYYIFLEATLPLPPLSALLCEMFPPKAYPQLFCKLFLLICSILKGLVLQPFFLRSKPNEREFPFFNGPPF